MGIGEDDAPSDTEAVHVAAADEDALKREEIVPHEEEEEHASARTSEEDVEKPRVMRNPKQPTKPR